MKKRKRRPLKGPRQLRWSRVVKESLKKLSDGVARLPPPTNAEAAAVTLQNPKTAALFFDRVWGGLDSRIPDSVGFWGATVSETAFMTTLGDMMQMHLEAGRQIDPNAERFELELTPDTTFDFVGFFARTVAEGVSVTRHLPIASMYSSALNRDREYAVGERAALVAAIEGLNLVSEQHLTWQHVLAVRQDTDALMKIRRLTRWLDETMVGKPQSFVEDAIALRLDEYEEALRKHGLQSFVGAIASTLDSQVLIGGPAAVAALSYAGQKGWALIAGGSIVVGKAAIHVVQQLLEYQSIKHRSEIAFLAQLNKR